MDIPGYVEIRSTIRPGSVYYFRHDSFSSPYQHYFVVINRDPLADAAVLLLCASSKVDNIRTCYSACPAETLVIVHPRQYSEFTVRTIINCNEVHQVTIPQLVKKRESGLLAFKSQMGSALIETLRRDHG